jgi:ABC-type xylose transport system permease subunit
VNSGILAGLGLSAACGWNTFAPLLVLALADRITSGDILGTGTGVAADHPFAFISSLAGILVWLGLTTLELVLDKIPRLDHALDALGSVLRPGTGALCFMAIGNHDHSIHPVIAMAFGLVIGGAVHWDKARRRLELAANSLGLGTPFVSMVEDGVSILTSICSLLLGILGPIAAVMSWLAVRAAYRWSTDFGRATIARAQARQGLRR